jgi:hypothetical protein
MMGPAPKIGPLGARLDVEVVVLAVPHEELGLIRPQLHQLVLPTLYGNQSLPRGEQVERVKRESPPAAVKMAQSRSKDAKNLHTLDDSHNSSLHTLSRLPCSQNTSYTYVKRERVGYNIWEEGMLFYCSSSHGFSFPILCDRLFQCVLYISSSSDWICFFQSFHAKCVLMLFKLRQYFSVVVAYTRLSNPERSNQ